MGQIDMPRRSVAEFLDHFVRLGTDVAYSGRVGYRTFRWTYRDVASLAFQFARELDARCLAKGDRILLWGPNSAEWVSAFFGCALRGVIAVPMDDAAAPDFAARVSQQVKAKLLVCAREHAQPHEAALPQSAVLFEELASAIAHRPADPLQAAEIDRDDPLEIVFTSGTTAEPKGVVITHGNVLANIAPLESEIRKYLKYERVVHPVRFLNLLPLSHVFGQFLGIFIPQLLGGTVLFQESFNPAEIIRTIHKERVSVLVSVPRVLQSLKEKIERDLEDTGRIEPFRRKFRQAEGKHFLRRWWTFRREHRRFGWKFWAFISGGAALDRVSEEFWGRLGFAVVQGYGLTETTSLISVNHPFRVGKGSIGKVLAGREVKLGPEGEILVRGGGVAAGYWGEQQLKPVKSEEGWYHTGDIGELDAEGNLYFKGRKKDVIVTPAGMNVYPEDLEDALRRQPEVRDCIVIGLPRQGNAEACSVLLLRDPNAAPEAVVSRANGLLAEHQKMRDWYVWPDEDFPRTSTQKPKRAEIQRFVQARMGKTAPGENASSPLSQLISRIKGGKTGALSAGTNLESDLNLSSLDRVELMSALEDRYQIDLNETGFSSVQTVGDLEKILHGERPTRVHYHYPRWVQRWPVTWVRLLAHYLLMRPAVFLLGWPRIVGREHLRGVQGPLLVICNHLSDVDVGFVATALPARFRNKLATAAGGEALEALHTPPAEKNVFRRIYDRMEWVLGVSLLNIFPLPRQAGFRESFAYAGECVDRGYSVLVFPEGRHSTDGRLNAFRSGIGLLANSLQVPVLPIRIDGLFELKQAKKRIAKPYAITVRVGEPIRFTGQHDPEWLTRELQKRVEIL